MRIFKKKKEKTKNMISISSNKVWLWWHGYWRVFNCNMWFHWKKSCCPCLMHIHENESIFPLYLWMVTEESSVVAEAVSRLTFSLTERLPYNYELGNTHTVSLFTFTFIDDNCSVNHISNEGGCLVHKLHKWELSLVNNKGYWLCMVKSLLDPNVISSYVQGL